MLLRTLFVGLPDREIHQSGVDAQFTRFRVNLLTRSGRCGCAVETQLSKFKRARFRPALRLVHLPIAHLVFFLGLNTDQDNEPPGIDQAPVLPNRRADLTRKRQEEPR